MSEPDGYEVIMTAGAKADLFAIRAYLVEEASELIASRVIARLEARVEGLYRFPNRGSVVREFAEIGMRQYRQLSEPPYRLIYRVADTQVLVTFIADGRRDVRTLLTRRLTSI